MVKYLKNKKAVGLKEQVILYILAMLALSAFIIFSNNYVSTSKLHVEKMAPDLTYEYEPLLVKSFLMLEVGEDDKKKLNLDTGDVIYVHDLIFLGDDDSKEVIESMKEEYLKNQNILKSFDSFNKFSGYNVKFDDLLEINYQANSIPDLKGEIENNNYVFYFKGKDSKYRYIYFRKSSLELDRINKKFSGIKMGGY